MPNYYIKHNSTSNSGRVFWLGSNNLWVEQLCNAVAYNTIDSAKAALAPLVHPSVSSHYTIVEEKVTLDTVFSGHQLISVRLNELANMVHGYTSCYIAEEIRKIAKEIKQ
jgi:hypothetical protein